MSEILSSQWSTCDREGRTLADHSTKTIQVRTARLRIGDRVLFGRGNSDRGRIGRPVRSITKITEVQDPRGRRQLVLSFADGDSTLGVYGAEAVAALQD